MSIESWVQNLAESSKNPTTFQNHRRNSIEEQEKDHWNIFIELCERYSMTYSRFGADTLTLVRSQQECQLILGCCQLSFQILTGMISFRLTRVQGYQVETLLSHDILAHHDSFGGLYWRLDQRVFSEEMLLRMTLEALVAAQPQKHKGNLHGNKVQRPRP